MSSQKFNSGSDTPITAGKIEALSRLISVQTQLVDVD